MQRKEQRSFDPRPIQLEIYNVIALSVGSMHGKDVTYWNTDWINDSGKFSHGDVIIPLKSVSAILHLILR